VAPERPLPPQVTMGLLDYLVATALDGDYAAAAAARERGATTRPRRHGWTALALGLFALVLSVAAVQSARAEPTRQQSRESLVGEARKAQSDLRSARGDVATLRSEVATLDARRVRLLRQVGATSEAARRTGATAGTVAVTGPGMVVTVDDAPDASSDREKVFDQDLQKLVNGLWAAGAEAVSINGQRISSLTAIRLAGQAITVNFRSLRRPYVVSAIGNPDALPARFVDTAGGTWWLNLRSVYGLRFDLASADDLRLPALRPPLVRFAEIDPSTRSSDQTSGGSS
jgi:uncharacterized protein YlxW (UPF0749 family)